MNKNLTFCIDVDGVLRDNLGIMVNLYNDAFDDSKKIEDIVDYRTDVMFPRIEGETGTTASKWFFQEHSKEIFEDAQPYPFVVEDIEKLREYGKVIIVTYQKTTLNKMQTLEWLDKHNIKYDGICFLKDKTLIKNSDYFIDDNDWNFGGMSSDCGVLIDAPYNKDKKLKDIKNDCNSMVRCKNLHEFVKKFIKVEKSLAEIEEKYMSKIFKLENSVLYEDEKTNKQCEFSNASEKVQVVNFYKKGLSAYAVIKIVGGWPSVSINAKDLEKYLICKH